MRRQAEIAAIGGDIPQLSQGMEKASRRSPGESRPLGHFRQRHDRVIHVKGTDNLQSARQGRDEFTGSRSLNHLDKMRDF